MHVYLLDSPEDGIGTASVSASSQKIMAKPENHSTACEYPCLPGRCKGRMLYCSRTYRGKGSVLLQPPGDRGILYKSGTPGFGQV